MRCWCPQLCSLCVSEAPGSDTGVKCGRPPGPARCVRMRHEKLRVSVPMSLPLPPRKCSGLPGKWHLAGRGWSSARHPCPQWPRHAGTQLCPLPSSRLRTGPWALPLLQEAVSEQGGGAVGWGTISRLPVPEAQLSGDRPGCPTRESRAVGPGATWGSTAVPCQSPAASPGHS